MSNFEKFKTFEPLASCLTIKRSTIHGLGLFATCEISQYTEIIDISVDDAYNGLTNSVRLGNMILCASNISELTMIDENYEAERTKIQSLEKICFNEGLEPVFFNLSEYMKSGAMLSCMIMHLNYVDYEKSLL